MKSYPLKKIFFVIVFEVLGSSYGFAFQGKSVMDTLKVSGYVDFNLYQDTRDFSTLTYNILLQLSDRFQYFSLTNHDGNIGSPDLAVTYAEHNLRYKLHKNKPFELTLQYVLRNGEQNDDIKLGVRWRASETKGLAQFFKKLNFFYSINPMIFQFRNLSKTKYATQLEHVYQIGILKDKLYLGGFADQIINYNNKMSFDWVTEHQLGYKIYNNLFIVLEYRINDFFENENYGVGYGVEYKVRF